MATPAQIAANRLNALKSTGPRSVEGKSVSRFNNLKSGLYATVLVLPGEDPAELEALAESCRRTWQPVGQDETELVDQLIESSWTQRRLTRLETELLTQLMSDESLPKNGLLGAAFAKDFQGAKMIQAIFREKHAARREWHKAFNAFLRLQELRLREQKAEREEDEVEPEPALPPAANWVRSSNSPQPFGPPRKIMTQAGPPRETEAVDDRALRL
jgi:hypothetical protein